MKKPHTLRFDDELWDEMGKVGGKMQPKENHTDFLHRAAWERIKKIKADKKSEKK